MATHMTKGTCCSIGYTVAGTKYQFHELPYQHWTNPTTNSSGTNTTVPVVPIVPSSNTTNTTVPVVPIVPASNTTNIIIDSCGNPDSTGSGSTLKYAFHALKNGICDENYVDAKFTSMAADMTIGTCCSIGYSVAGAKYQFNYNGNLLPFQHWTKPAAAKHNSAKFLPGKNVSGGGKVTSNGGKVDVS